MTTKNTATDRKLNEDEWADIAPDGDFISRGAEGDLVVGYNADLDLEIDLARSIPEGPALFEVKEITDTSDGPSGYANIRMRVAALNGEGEGKTLLHQVSLSPKADWRLNQFLDALRLPPKGKTSPGKWIGLRFWGNVIHEEWQGRTRPKIDEYLLNKSTELESERVKPKRNGKKASANLGSEFE